MPLISTQAGDSWQSLLAKDVASSSAEAFLRAAEGCEGDTLSRLYSNATEACEAFTSSVSAAVECVVQARTNVRRKASMLSASRVKWLGLQSAEFDSVKVLLEGWERQLCANCCNSEDVDAIEVSMVTADQILRDLTFFPVSSSMICVGHGALSEVSTVSHVQEAVDAARSVVSCCPLLKGTEGNTMTISCRDACGDPVRALKVEDVTAGLAVPTQGWSLSAPTIEDGTVSVRVSLATDAANTASLCAVIACTSFLLPLQVIVPSVPVRSFQIVCYIF